MAKFSAIITDKVGLHARPASVLAKEASKFSSNITIIANEKQGNLKSIMNVMAMAIKTGTEITIQVDGNDADQAIQAIKQTMIDTALIQG
ncbi:HPr family phosphocarrier protein [Mycoplasma capricolum subsp. capripneumoniae]|uniref:HPr family phosphocarrier protein n=1 Tax=Mycoplasma capricolum TaxID=2095 RepID=UPI0014043BE4|nr:HPr family phosphocarrier protein [Mycoplasma capricolum]QIN43986.1 HPr family phosphocarrier protein [Mycoplasma capricolum subsp. capripneumoniae]QIN44672.1 HPr family phosphocarrier protein [Mycoplasma capricolum subsp. capripneumoniae]